MSTRHRQPGCLFRGLNGLRVIATFGSFVILAACAIKANPEGDRD